MSDSTRARVAAIVAAASRDQDVFFVYDHVSGVHRNTSVYLGNGRVSGYDHGTSSYFFGYPGGSGNLDFFDLETTKHIRLKMTGNNFAGYDFHSGEHFSGTIDHSSVSLYDCDTGRHYSFRV